MRISEEDNIEIIDVEKDKKLNVKEILNKKKLTPFELDLIMNGS